MSTIQDPQPAKVYDTEARRQLARESVKALDVKQPRGIPRPDGPHGAGVVLRQFLTSSMGPDFFADLASEYPTLAHWSILGRHLYVINDAELIDHVHRVHARELVKSRALMEAKVLLGNGLLTNEGGDHLRQRRLVQPAFHRDRIREYATRMVAATVEHEHTWREGARVDMATDMSALTLDIVGRTLFSADLRGDAAEVGDSLNVLLEAFPKLMLPGGQLIARIPGTALHNLPSELDGLDEVVQRMIDEHRALGDTGDLLSMLISAQEDGRGMTDAQLRDEVMTLVLAGHETTAMTLTWTWYLLSCYPAEYAKVREELQRVLPDGRTPSFDDLAQLPRIRAVILESMRLFPPAWIIGRSTTTDLEIAGWQLPRGSIVLTSQYAMHRSPRYWESALTFRPDRWLDDEGHCDERNPGQPKGSWFPFGYGKRKCIGDQFALTEAGLVLATLASRWHPQLESGTPIEPLGAVTLRPKNGMPMVLRKADH